MQHLEGVSRVSGPVSLHVFQVNTTTPKTTPNNGVKTPPKTSTVYLFGDRHFSYENRCTQCTRSRGCYAIADLIERMAMDSVQKGKSMDVFMELPFASADAKLRQQTLKHAEQLFSKGSILGNALDRLVGRSPQYVGIFSDLYERFKHATYRHQGQKSRVRFHYGDARFEANAMQLLMPLNKSRDWLQGLIVTLPTADKVAALLRAFVMGSSFREDVLAVLGPDYPVPIVESALSNLDVLSADGKTRRVRVHKIAKQFHRLPERLKPVVRRYLEDRISRVHDLLKDVVNYDDGTRLLRRDVLKGVVATSTEANLARELMQHRAQSFLQDACVALAYMVCVVLMDAYLLCRLLRYLFRADVEDGSCVVVYAGDAHIESYTEFFNVYLPGTSESVPLVCEAQVWPDDNDPSRCVPVTNACDRPALKSRVRTHVVKPGASALSLESRPKGRASRRRQRTVGSEKKAARGVR